MPNIKTHMPLLINDVVEVSFSNCKKGDIQYCVTAFGGNAKTNELSEIRLMQMTLDSKYPELLIIKKVQTPKK